MAEAMMIGSSRFADAPGGFHHAIARTSRTTL
jgi:hypothetical protein